eukprot:CAMPEP_0202038906 /NCGR_PEP_ID=MMETSP0962-20130828/13122_1 /ASSEMBLY_ACC=CAM_ASM_000488 /TAXON_ID=4773 /ORGANISM="Schizochytrium aggregatum, Strain ATCC28209" /LENGTH=94 /DNA_ID=CAMNT_0048603095 /DNA_START=45 /DNA_END=327 /DNA_ORIENTATION=-
MATRHSGLQRQVLALYREALRKARRKDPDSVETVRAAFRRSQDVPKKDFRTIEFLLRQGERRVKMLDDPDVRGVKVFRVAAAAPERRARCPAAA